ncbi:hypothetical protein, partial [Microvirga sp. Mcv34]|uniref:hypothetical protein n=1 Tax=Microvirga sp. Mcv34 TaxID=2926016 RepID=UPI0021C80601
MLSGFKSEYLSGLRRNPQSASLWTWIDARGIAKGSIHDVQNALPAELLPSPRLNGAADFGPLDVQVIASIGIGHRGPEQGR